MFIDRATLVVTVLSALGSGLIAGVFFIFSVAIMRALERLPNGAAAMNMISVVIINPMFLGVFMGTAVLCILLAIGSVFRWQQPGTIWLLTGALLYLIGSIGVTMIFNVPMNNTLAAATAENTESVWKDYLTNWTFWNHVRTIASLAASASFMVALIYER